MRKVQVIAVGIEPLNYQPRLIEASVCGALFVSHEVTCEGRVPLYALKHRRDIHIRDNLHTTSISRKTDLTTHTSRECLPCSHKIVNIAMILSRNSRISANLPTHYEPCFE